MSEWSKEYDNDTGPDDDYFEEWWTVTYGTRKYRCATEEDADFLVALLKEAEQLRRASKYPPIFNGLSGNEIEEGLLRSKYELETAKAWRAGVWWAYEKLKDKNT